MKNLYYTLVVLSVFLVTGCAGIEPPDPEKIISHPLGAGPLSAGMTKEEVKGLWGEPDLKRSTGESMDASPTEREEWVYYGRVTNLPISYGYISKPLHIYFDGNNVMSFSEE